MAMPVFAPGAGGGMVHYPTFLPSYAAAPGSAGRPGAGMVQMATPAMYGGSAAFYTPINAYGHPLVRGGSASTSGSGSGIFGVHYPILPAPAVLHDPYQLASSYVRPPPTPAATGGASTDATAGAPAPTSAAAAPLPQQQLQQQQQQQAGMARSNSAMYPRGFWPEAGSGPILVHQMHPQGGLSWLSMHPDHAVALGALPPGRGGGPLATTWHMLDRSNSAVFHHTRDPGSPSVPSGSAPLAGDQMWRRSLSFEAIEPALHASAGYTARHGFSSISDLAATAAAISEGFQPYALAPRPAGPVAPAPAPAPAPAAPAPPTQASSAAATASPTTDP
jgi:hypothetical protein